MVPYIKEQLSMMATLCVLNMCAEYVIFVTGIESFLAIPDIKGKQEIDKTIKLCYVILKGWAKT